MRRRLSLPTPVLDRDPLRGLVFSWLTGATQMNLARARSTPHKQRRQAQGGRGPYWWLLIVGTITAPVLLSVSAFSMDFAIQGAAERKIVVATGPIEIGDAKKLAEVAGLATLDGRGLRKMLLRSPGGNVGEAIKIAGIISEFDYEILVDGDCASACSMILYPAGKYFVLLDGGRLGFHQCSRSLTSQAVPECTDAIAKIAADRGFPYGSMKMFASMAEPSEMYWISNVLSPCYGMEKLPGDPPSTSQTHPCPHAVLTMMNSKYREGRNRIGPSFDCSKLLAPGPVEVILCNDRELMHIDAIMGKVYRMIVSRSSENERQTIQKEQRNWIKSRDGKCSLLMQEAQSYSASRGTARCLSEEIMVRLGKLLEINGTPLTSIGELFERAIQDQRRRSGK